MSNAPQPPKDWRDEIEITPEMTEAGEVVLADLEGEAFRSTLAKEVYAAMEYVRRGGDRPAIEKDREKEFLIARAIHRGLLDQRELTRGYVGSTEPEPHVKTLIDGEFYLMAVARVVLRELR